MRCKEPCWQRDDPSRIVVWQPASPPRAVEGPLPLECFDGRCLVLELASQQIACREDGGNLQQVLLGGVHRLEIGKRQEQIPPSSRFVFLRSDASFDLRWSQNANLVWDPAAGGAADSAGSRSGAARRDIRLPLRGTCRLHLSEPLHFYRSVLQGLNKPLQGDLLNVLDALVRTNLAARLAPLLHSGNLDRLCAQALVAALRPADLGEDLEPLGLDCLHLAAYLPLNNDQPAPSEAAVASVSGSYDDLL